MAVNIKTAERIIPMIYAYSTPEVKRHNGWVKIGYTDKQDVDDRIKQQTHTADVFAKKEWQGNAIYEDGTGDFFHDSDFHRYLQKKGVNRTPNTEWFQVDGSGSLNLFNEFRMNRGLLKSDETVPYTLRAEQKRAVEQTAAYHTDHPKTGEMLWNAKPRFGKTLSAYDLAKTIGAKSVLILTNRPAIANSWYADYVKFLGTESGYRFVSETSSLKGKKYVRTLPEYLLEKQENPDLIIIEFVSLQDLKGSIHGGGKYEKLEEVYYRSEPWDLVIIDEAHEGVDTVKTEISLDRIPHNFTLHLSGTPFKALANEKFPEKAIFNWTYADEQKAKKDWNSDAENPYASLPQLNLFTYQMSEMIKDEISEGINLNGEQEEYAFDLNEFFAVKNGKFIHDEDVDRFLDALTIREKYPFSTPELRDELKHTFWLLPKRVEIAKAMAKKLKEHPIFKDYEIVLAAGNGKLDEDDLSDEANLKSFDKVRKAIQEHDKTITLSVGQLTTGVTIPEWTAVLMLSNMKSPAEYMQAAFRAQNPYVFKKNGQNYRKERAYVFDFDPIRTLDIYNQFANDLSSNTSGGKGSSDEHKENVRILLNFFPVLGEDSQGRMVELDAEKVLSIPKKLRAKEVVNRGFMSDFLFQNITRVFNAPKAVVDAIKTMNPVTKDEAIDLSKTKDLDLNEEGEVEIPEEKIDQKTETVFGPKIYENLKDKAEDAFEEIKKNPPKGKEDPDLEKAKAIFAKDVAKTILDKAKDTYGPNLSARGKQRLTSKIERDATQQIGNVFEQQRIDKNISEHERQKHLESAKTEDEKKKINKEFDERNKQIDQTFEKNLNDAVESVSINAAKETVKTVETEKQEKESQAVQTTIKDHLRGFSRTIPSFLMSYGDDDTRLDNFDQKVPEDVFQEVTSISTDMFRKLRDGGEFENEETEEVETFAGGIFDRVVFDDSIREFMDKRYMLANYFDEKTKGDIFDYIPPQKTNQIFTPKWVVKKMVDELEEENPGCFDDPNWTFIDLYMKSGLYPAEVIKRLYQSPKLIELYPDKNERLKHIIEKQVFGLAPTEIIYRIATNFILGFDITGKIKNHNFKKVDALEYAKEGKLQDKLDEVFG